MLDSNRLPPATTLSASAEPLTPADLSAHLMLGRLAVEDLTQLAELLERVQAPAGTTVIAQGEAEQALYFILEGQARAVRDGLDIGTIEQGEHFGELAMVLGQPRAASVQAITDLQLGRLQRSRYVEARASNPGLVARLLESLVAGAATRLQAMTDSVGLLLRDRSLARRAEVKVRLAGDWLTLRTGTTAGAILPRAVDGEPVVAALVDHRMVPLSWPLTSQCSVEALTTADWEGQELLRNAAALLFLEAAWRLDPGLHVEMGYSVGVGRRIDVRGRPAEDLPQLAQDLDTSLCALLRSAPRPREEQWAVEEAREHFLDRGWHGAAALLRTWHFRTVPMCSYGDLYALSFAPLVENHRLLSGARVAHDSSGLYLSYPKHAAVHSGTRERLQVDVHAVSAQTTEMTSPQERWLEAVGVRTVGAFNDACIRGDVAQMIRVAEGFQERRIIDIADRIRERHDQVRIVCIAGPSSSGKTTFIKRLNVQLQVDGLKPIGLSLDNYYVDREHTPRDAKGEYDFEALEALRLDLLSEHMAALLRGEEVATAYFDFQTGRSLPDGGPKLRLAGDEILLLEGIHGLNPGLFPSIDPSQLFKIFVSPLAQLPFDRLNRINASDVRLLRRIVRDRHTRNHDAAATIQRWPSVRNGERFHIFPFQGQATAVFDSSLLYELSVLKVFAQRYLLEVPTGDPAYTTASRLLALLDRFVTIYPDHVPTTSILREFIGSSGFEY